MDPSINLFRRRAWVGFRSRKCKSDSVHVQQGGHAFLPASELLTGEDFNFRDVWKWFRKSGFYCENNVRRFWSRVVVVVCMFSHKSLQL